MFAMHALVVVEYALVQHLTELGACYADRGCTDHAADQGTGKAAHQGAGGACDDSEGQARAGTGQDTAHTGHATGNGADSTTGSAAQITGGDQTRTTFRTLNAHEGLSEKEMTDARLPAIPRGTGMKACGAKPRTIQRRGWKVLG